MNQPAAVGQKRQTVSVSVPVAGAELDSSAGRLPGMVRIFPPPSRGGLAERQAAEITYYHVSPHTKYRYWPVR